MYWCWCCCYCCQSSICYTATFWPSLVSVRLWWLLSFGPPPWPVWARNTPVAAKGQSPTIGPARSTRDRVWEGEGEEEEVWGRGEGGVATPCSRRDSSPRPETPYSATAPAIARPLSRTRRSSPLPSPNPRGPTNSGQSEEQRWAGMQYARWNLRLKDPPRKRQPPNKGHNSRPLYSSRSLQLPLNGEQNGWSQSVLYFRGYTLSM